MSIEIKRFIEDEEPGHGLYQHPEGDWVQFVDHQAEVERLTAENTALRFAGEVVAGAIPRLDASRARAAELERVLRIVEDTLPHISSENRTVGSLLFTVQQALAKGKCCTPTEEEEALLASGDYRPEELWGGSRPTCPKCIGQTTEPATPCAAEWQGHQCSTPRAEDSLFCSQHRSVDGRQRMGGDPLTNEQLASMMQRDGEIQ